MPVAISNEEHGSVEDTIDRWFLRTAGDTVYGSISLATLCDWAERGRLRPDNEISRNARDWVPAESIPDLKMDWLVAHKSGDMYGPFNLLSVPDLLRRGLVDQDAVLRNRITGREVPVSSLVRAEPDDTARPERDSSAKTAGPRPHRIMEAPRVEGEPDFPLLKTETRGARIAMRPPPVSIDTDEKEEEKEPVVVQEVRNREREEELAGRIREMEAALRKEKQDHEHRLRALSEETAGHERTRTRMLAVEQEKEQLLAEKSRIEEALNQRLEVANTEQRELERRLKRELAESEQVSRQRLKDLTSLQVDLTAERRSHAAANKQFSQREDELAAQIEELATGEHRRKSTESEQKTTELEQKAAGLEQKAEQLAEKLKQKEPAEAMWYMRSKTELAQGPIPLTQLCEWAAECRVGPAHEVSLDKQKWISVAEVPELGIEWSVKLVDGSTYGPLNLFALRHLISDGVVGPDAEIVNRKSGKKGTAGEELLAGVVALVAEKEHLARELKHRETLLKSEQKRNLDLVRQVAAAKRASHKPDGETDRQEGLPPRMLHKIVQKRPSE